MKVGDEVNVSLLKMVEAKVGSLVDYSPEGSAESFVARIVAANEDGAVLRIVPSTTKE